MSKCFERLDNFLEMATRDDVCLTRVAFGDNLSSNLIASLPCHIQPFIRHVFAAAFIPELVNNLSSKNSVILRTLIVPRSTKLSLLL